MIRRINTKYRKVRLKTDVISTPFQSVAQGATPLPFKDIFDLGKLFISVPYVVQYCQETNSDLHEEMSWQCTHGILHLLGYDHERSLDAERLMQQEEQKMKVYLKGLQDKRQLLPPEPAPPEHELLRRKISSQLILRAAHLNRPERRELLAAACGR